MTPGNGKPTSFLLVGPNGSLPLRSTVPPHLSGTPWVKHEETTAKSAFKDVSREIKRLSEKVTEKRVHDTRVALRRWFSIWRVLREDGWQTDKCKKSYIKPLKKLQQTLGALRDMDVNIELGGKLGCTESTLAAWSERRQHLKEKLEKFVKTSDIDGIVADLKEYMRRQARKVGAKLPRAKSGQSAFDHLELYLLHQESIVREEADTAQTPEEMHELRLSIKRWRYLLTEYFGLTNLQLVRAQQLLGQLHDLDRLTPLLVHDDEQRLALLNLKERRHKVLNEIAEMRLKLPYGLRPQVTGVKPPAPAAFEEREHK